MTSDLLQEAYGIVSFLQKNVYTEYVYSYFVYTGKKLSS